MLDMSWGEVMVIGAVALIVIGPKDLPKALRTVGQVTGKIRRMASEFQGQFNEAMREADLDEVKRQIQGVNDSVGSLNEGFNPMQSIRDELKGAVDGAGAPKDKTPGETVSEAAAQARGEAHPPSPVEPTVALSVPSVPPIVDPAESVAMAVKQSAAVTVSDTPPEPAPAPSAPSAKPSERAE
jgi:sec-independent protein translocase protein TatB